MSDDHRPDLLARPWPELLGLFEAQGLAHGFSTSEVKELASNRLREVLRWTRPDGSAVFEPRVRSRERLRTLRSWAAWAGDPALATVVHQWSPSVELEIDGTLAPPPLPASSHSLFPMAMLRPNWQPKGDLVAVDHLQPGLQSQVEVAAKGITWLGPSWTSPGRPRSLTLARPTFWSTGAFADCVEWSVVEGKNPTTRTAVLLRSRGMALLAQQSAGSEPMLEIRLGLPGGVEARPDSLTRSLVLSAGKGKPTARLVPLGLPATPYPTDRGSISVEGREVVVRQRGEGRCRWLPLLVAWDKAPTFWRSLTVSSRSEPCRPEEAFAVRVAWGSNDDGLVIYRSLAAPDLRAFLGHQTKARFLVGSFNKMGDVRPILKVQASSSSAKSAPPTTT